MMRAALLGVAVLGAVACGGSPSSPRAPDNVAAPAPAPDDPAAVIAALAAAARADDPAALAAVVHPVHGATLWYQPGAHLAPLVHVAPGEAASPRAVVAGAVDGYWADPYWPELAGTVERGLARLDRDPVDPTSAAYGTCDDDGAGTFRAYLVRGADLGVTGEIAADLGVALAPAVTQDLVHFHAWGADVYLAASESGWRVVHVMVWTPCDA